MESLHTRDYSADWGYSTDRDLCAEVGCLYPNREVSPDFDAGEIVEKELKFEGNNMRLVGPCYVQCKNESTDR